MEYLYACIPRGIEIYKGIQSKRDITYTALFSSIFKDRISFHLPQALEDGKV